MKTYVLMLSKHFPKSHKRAGEETGFADKFLSGDKIHTIRDNVGFWRNRINRVSIGDAVLSIRQWSGKPYHSKQIEIRSLAGPDIGYEVVVFGICNAYLYSTTGKTAFDATPYPVSVIAKNDGLTQDDFNNWFELDQPLKTSIAKAVIHFTKFRYV